MLSVGKVLVFKAGLLQYLAKNIALLVQNFCWDFFGQNPFSAILSLKKQNKKVPMATKLEGRGVGRGLSGRNTKKDLYCGFPKAGRRIRMGLTRIQPSKNSEIGSATLVKSTA